MSLNVWAKSGWLKVHPPTKQQVAAIFGVVDRDLEDSRSNLSPDGQFNIAYNAALQLCAIALLAEGWKAEKIKAHYLTITALPASGNVIRNGSFGFSSSRRPTAAMFVINGPLLSAAPRP